MAPELGEEKRDGGGFRRPYDAGKSRMEGIQLTTHGQGRCRDEWAEKMGYDNL